MSFLKDTVIKVVIDLLCLFFVFLPWIVLQAVNTPYRRGFYCNDNSIKYPYKENTVTNTVLTASGFVIAFVVVAVCESLIYFLDTNGRDPPLNLTSTLSIPRFVVNIYKYFGIFVFGLAAQQTLTNIGKFTIGRLRPHFLSVCDPDYSKINCTLPGHDNIFIYVTEYSCKSELGKAALDSRLSFPSGHSSFSVYVAIYLTLYLQCRMTWRVSKLLRNLIQALLIYGAFYVCLSRVSDFKHHPTDVLSGAIIGFFVAALVGVHIANFFSIKGLLTGLGYCGGGRAGPTTSINMLGHDDHSHPERIEAMKTNNLHQMRENHLPNAMQYSI